MTYSDFESLLEDQFQLDLISDSKVEEQERWDELMDRRDRDISNSINSCISIMNRRRYY